MLKSESSKYTLETRFVINTSQIGALNKFQYRKGKTYNVKDFNKKPYSRVEVFISGKYSRRELNKMFGINANVQGVKLV
jgi:hypothetical protein